MFRFRFLFDVFQAKAMSGPFVEVNMRAKWISRLCPTDLQIAFAPSAGQVPMYDSANVPIVSKESPGWWNHCLNNYTYDYIAVQKAEQYWSLGPNIELANPLRMRIPLVVSSNYHKGLLRKAWSYPGNRVFVIPNIVDPELFYPREKAARFTVGWIGHDVDAIKIKGPETIPYLARRFPDIQFEMVFAAQSVAQYQWLNGELPNVRILYEVPHAKMPEVIGKWNVLLCGSKDENCPNQILEAMRCGIPVIAPAVGGIPEVAQSQILLSDMQVGQPPEVSFPHQWTNAALEKFAHALDQLINDPAKQVALANAAIQESKRFDPQVISRKWFEFIYLCRDLYG